MAELSARQERLCQESRWDFSDLRAMYVNCTLKRSPEVSNTQGLADLSIAIMERNGVTVEVIRAVDHAIATGVYPDMTEHGWERDDWPAISERVMASDILVLTSPIWLGEKSSVCTRVIERLYGNSHLLNEHGQYAYYGRVGGCIITGNEDGAKHCAMNILYSLQHLGYTIPPQADSAWIGEAGPGPSYLDPGSGGPENDFTNRNTTFLTWNLLHLARMLRDRGGISAHGNQRADWDAGCRFRVRAVGAGDRSGRLFIVDQVGAIRVLDAGGTLRSEPFLDLRSSIVPLMPDFDERGLLGLAFHPGYAGNGRLFVYYSAPLRPGAPAGYNHTSRVSELRVSAEDPNRADPASERVLLELDEPQFNHNAGTLVFGPDDGYLYISVGDGGGADDVGLGHVEDWYRMSFDMGGSHDLFVGDDPGAFRDAGERQQRH
jgi:multimeric flavodoxin WrbA